MRGATGIRAALLAAAAPGWVAAQQDAVVVSATRQPQPSLEIPASVDRIYADEIRDGRPQVNLSESLGRVPGIVVQNRQNYAQDLQISSRGFGARSTFGVRGIRLIADGIPATMPDGQGQAATFALGSAASIEVLRGPFSSLYGNASGGVISVQTEDGPEIPTGELDLLAGSYRTRRAALKLGGQSGIANGIADLSRFETDGYRRHSAAKRDHLNGKVRFDGDSSSFTLIGNSLRQPDTQDPLGLTRAQFDQDARQATATALQFNTRKSVFQDQMGGAFNHRIDNTQRLQATLYGGQRYVEQFLAIPTTTQSDVRHSGGVVNLDRGYGGAALRYFKDLSPFKLAFGVEYERMDERRKGFFNDNGVATFLKRDEDNTVASTDLYAQGEWKFAERWSAMAGVRASSVHFESVDHFVVPGNGDDSGERTYRATTPVAGLVFRLTPLTSFYGNVGRGFESPTFAELAYRTVSGTATGLNFALDASYSRHAEAGVKTIVPGWARINAALFNVVTRNEIVTDQNQGGRSTFKNAGHTDRNGIELGAETITGGPLEARFAFTYLKAAFREGFTTLTGTPSVPVTVQGGSLIPGVPKSQLYGELRYRRERYFAQLEGLHKSRVPVNDQNSEFADAYTTVNIVGGLTQQARSWRLTEFVRVDNLTDRNYVGSVIVNDANSRYYEPSPRRNMTVGVQARLQF
jgi:iron complex outermembrane recepter protein